MRGELSHFPFVRRKELKGGEGDDDECDTRAGEQASERESERQKSGRKEICSRVGAATKRKREREGEGERKTGLSVRCRSKQEVNKANELGTPSLAKGRSESAAKGQQSEWVNEWVCEWASTALEWVFFPHIFQPVECVARLPPRLQYPLPPSSLTSPLSSSLNGQLIAGTRLKNRTIKNAAKKQQLNGAQVKNSHAEPFLKNREKEEKKKKQITATFLCQFFMRDWGDSCGLTFKWFYFDFYGKDMRQERQTARESEGELMLKRSAACFCIYFTVR